MQACGWCMVVMLVVKQEGTKSDDNDKHRPLTLVAPSNRLCCALTRRSCQLAHYANVTAIFHSVTSSSHIVLTFPCSLLFPVGFTIWHRQ